MAKIINILKEFYVKYKVYLIAAVGILVLVTVIGIFYIHKNKITAEEEMQVYVYESETETYLAENTVGYLEQYVLLKDEEKGKIANIAVETYDKILASGVEVVTEEHTAAIEKRIADALKEVISDEQITNEDMELLASGVSQLIWDTVKTQLDASVFQQDVQYKEEYERLANSLQTQIDSLDDKISRLKLSASIKIESPEEAIENSKTEIYESVEKEMIYLEEDILNSVDLEMQNMKSEIVAEMKNKYGNITSGKDGKDGKDGDTGKAGVDGKDGSDGKTTYIAYAEDENGTGFSLTPTETTKYIGTCISASVTAPVDPTEYQNWQPYRSYIMTTTIDENGETTLHIN